MSKGTNASTPRHPTSTDPLAPTALIVGCGYLGRHVATRLIHRGVTVYGTTRRHENAPPLSQLGVRVMIISVTQPVTLAALRPVLEANALDVYYMVPPGRPDQSPSPRQVILGGIGHMLKALRNAHVRRALLVSSTAVYGQADSRRVDAQTPPEPLDERGKLLCDGESLWLGAGRGYYVVRLAGLYGPGRIIGLRAVQERAPLLGNPAALMNVIHVEDAATLVEAIMIGAAGGQSGPARIELGCDGNPTQRIDYYSYLAEKLGVSPPSIMSPEEAQLRLGVNAERLRRSSSKALDNVPTCRRTGWSPSYPNFRIGLDAML